MGSTINVTKRASNAIYKLEIANDVLRPGLSGKLESSAVFTAISLIEDAQRLMCQMISQDLKLEEP